jgi:hypothetical protein
LWRVSKKIPKLGDGIDIPMIFGFPIWDDQQVNTVADHGFLKSYGEVMVVKPITPHQMCGIPSGNLPQLLKMAHRNS